MSLVHNEYETRPEVVFITYEDVIKTPYPFLLNKIDTRLREFYEPFIDVDKFKGLDMNNLLRLCTQRNDRNVFRWLAKKDFDIDGSLKELKDRYFELYKDSELLKIGESVKLMLTQKFTKKIYIYSEVYDIRIHLDIQESFQDMKRVNYITGDFEKVLDKVEGVTSFIVSDFDYVYDIIQKEKADYTNILLGNYGYNFIFNEDTNAMEFRLDHKKLIGDRVCKFSTFIPAEFKSKHFTQLEV
jgi:hypothetical protein